jgi:nucleoside phosphorylase
VGGTRLVLTHTGDGATRARAGVRALLEQFPVQRLLILGVAGALTPDLEIGDIVVAREVRDEEGQPGPAPDLPWLREALASTRAEPGTLVSAGALLTRHADKAAFQETLAGPWPAVVDLETLTFARAASEAGVAYLVARAISDRADEDLPHFLHLCQGRDGRVNRVRVALFCLIRPWTLRSLFVLRGRMILCSRSLAEFALRLLWPAGVEPDATRRAY